MKKELILKTIENEKVRSKWDRGVLEYAYEIIESLDNGLIIDLKTLLNGAKSWEQYSWGGCSLIYDEDICERLATPSEQKRTQNGSKKPNVNEEWLDTQARALHHAAHYILRKFRNETIEE